MATVARLYDNGDLHSLASFIENDATKPHVTTAGNFEATVFNEVGNSTALTNWYPLSIDSKDYVAKRDAVVSGAVLGAGLRQGCYTFDGVNDYLKVTDNFTSGFTAMTLSLWIKPTAGGVDYRCALHKGPDSSIGAAEYWAGVSAGGLLTATIGAVTAGWAAGETTTAAVMGTWYMLSATWNGTTVRVYINGNEVKSYALASKASLVQPTRFGASADGTSYQYAGSIQDARFYSRALTAAELKLLYELTTVSQMKLTSSTVCVAGEIKEGL